MAFGKKKRTRHEICEYVCPQSTSLWPFTLFLSVSRGIKEEVVISEIESPQEVPMAIIHASFSILTMKAFY